MLCQSAYLYSGLNTINPTGGRSADPDIILFHLDSPLVGKGLCLARAANMGAGENVKYAKRVQKHKAGLQPSLLAFCT